MSKALKVQPLRTLEYEGYEIRVYMYNVTTYKDGVYIEHSSNVKSAKNKIDARERANITPKPLIKA